MLTRKQRHDRHDVDPSEARLIRTGHLLWRRYRREGRPDYLLAALEHVWQAKRAFRADLTARRAAEAAAYRERIASGQLTFADAA